MLPLTIQFLKQVKYCVQSDDRSLLWSGLQTWMVSCKGFIIN